jgi:hypothetical protein
MSIDTACPTHPACEAAVAMSAALDTMLDASLWSLSTAELTGLMARQHELLARLDAAVLATTREFDARGTALAQGASSAQEWLRDRLLVRPSEARRRVKVAEALDHRYEPVHAAQRAGWLSPAHTQVITKALDGLPAWADPDARAWAQTELLDAARTLDPDQLAKAAQRIRDALDPDGPEERERDAVAQRTLSHIDRGNGTHRITGILDDLGAALVKSALDPLAAPRPADDGTPDPRSPGRRRADALLELVERALRRGLSRRRGTRPHLLVHAGLDTLLKLPGAPTATASSGETISAQTLRRIACDADVTRVFTDPHGAVLDVGRRFRCVGHSTWIALTVRDKGCVFPGCTRPSAWTDAHHLTHWADGGVTSLDNCALLCGHHHDAVHHRGRQIRLGTDRKPELIPPAWIDPDRKPRRNTYWDTPRFTRD